MWKLLKNFIDYMEEKTSGTLSSDEKAQLKDELLTKLQFFQHERLIHLIVTFIFSVCAVLSLLGFVLLENISVGFLFILILALLIPYIVHYYHLENGVQKLYTYYDKLK